MSQVPAINGKNGSGWEMVPAAGSKGEGAPVDFNEDLSGQIPKDKVLLSDEWPDTDWNHMVNITLDRLKEQYPSIRIVVDEKENGGELSGLAAALGKGTHLVLSRKFLERMGSNTEEFSRCSSVLAGLAKQLAVQKQASIAAGVYVGQSGAAFWTVEKKPEEQAAEEEQAGLSGFSGYLDTAPDKGEIISRQLRKTASVSVSRHYSRLAGARTKGQIQTVMADVNRSIGNLQMTAVYGDEEERVKAGRALRSLKKLLAKSSRKISRLNREQLAAVRKKKAEKEREVKKAEQAREEMKRMRAKKAGFNHSLVMQGMAEESYIRGYKHYRKIKEEYGGSPMTDTVMLPDGISPAGSVEGTVGAEGDITAAEVTVSGTFTY